MVVPAGRAGEVPNYQSTTERGPDRVTAALRPRTARTIIFILGFLLILTSSMVSFASQVCRTSSFEGLDARTAQIHDLLGEDTIDPTSIRLYVTQVQGKNGVVRYIQSNFRSEMPDHPGQHAQFPTKLLTNDIIDLRAALENIVFWQSLPDDADDRIARIAATAEVYVDPSILDKYGNIGINLSGAGTIRLATDRKVLPTGQIDVLPRKTPPPSLVERIFGCCLKGQPPGRSEAIMARLSNRSIDASSVVLLNLVSDSATWAELRHSPRLLGAANRAGYAASDKWSVRVDKAMQSSRGGTLVVLSHIDGDNVVVEGADGTTLYSVPLTQISSMARTNNVNLILFGCDTAAAIDRNSLSIGVVGSYNTWQAARRINAALATSANAADFVKAVSSAHITMVVNMAEGTGEGFQGASAYAPVRGDNFLARVFRVFFLGRAE